MLSSKVLPLALAVTAAITPVVALADRGPDARGAVPGLYAGLPADALPAAAREQALADHRELARRLAPAGDQHPLPAQAGVSLAELRQENRVLRAALRTEASLPQVAVPPVMARIAECESHGNPRSIGGGGLYRGKYQMTTSIWASVGGHGDPAAASETEQDRRAALLYERSGPSQWPVCGR